MSHGTKEVPLKQVFPTLGANARSGVVSGAGSSPAGGAGAAPSIALFAGGVGPNSEPAVRSAWLYDVASDSWESLQMGEARAGHTLTVLSGGRALIAGGLRGPGDLGTSAELFRLDTKSFAPTGSMSVSRIWHAAALLPGGRVLITGGSVPVGGGPAAQVTAAAEIYDPATGTFTPTGSMATGRTLHTPTALPDGRVLVVGGNSDTQRLQSAELYDPASGTFSPAGYMLAIHGRGHTATRLASGKVLILGGFETVSRPTAAAEIFDPATNKFTSAGNMTAARADHFAVLLNDGRVLIGGGWSDEGDILKSTEIYDPVSNTFTPAQDTPRPGVEWTALFLSKE